MNPLEPKSALRTITSTLALALLVAIATYIILLIVGAGRLSHAAVPATVHGPFNLFELQKEAATGGGYQASIALLPASGYYALVCLTAAIAACWARLRNRPASHTARS
jgi:hypothetical protein